MLVAIEGNNGAGKSTLIKNLKLLMINEIVITTEYNSTEPIKQYIKYLRDSKNLIDPNLYEYLQIADIYCRTSSLQKEIMEKETIVLFDRYIETLLVRGLVRGVDKKQSEFLCSLLPKPDITIYLDISAEESLKRVLQRGKLTNRMWCIALRNDLEPDLLDKALYLENLKRMNFEYKNIENSHKFIFNALNESSKIAEEVYKLILEWREQ